MTGSKYQIGFLAVVALVALRVGVGWHFFTQGLKKYADPNYSSEAFLRQAKGPFVEYYHRLLDKDRGFDAHVERWLQSALPDHESKPDQIKKPKSLPPPEKSSLAIWADKVVRDWGEYRNRIERHYGFSEEQKAQAQRLIDEYRTRLSEVVSQAENWLKSEPQEAVSLHRVQSDPLLEQVPFAKTRVADQAAKVRPHTAKLLAEAKKLDSEFDGAMRLLLTSEQRQKSSLPAERTPLEKFDLFLTYSLLAGGVCLMIGLFTRLAALGCAFFLLTVIGTQPPWVLDALPTYEQAIELLALLVIAATAAGRWAGLDYFLSRCCGSGGVTK